MKISLLIIIIIVALCDTTSRVKRKVLFRKNSKFFVRLNGKEPVLPFTTIFQHGWGFRMNFDMPDSIPTLHKFYRRDVSNDIQPYFQRPELNNYFCVLKYFAGRLNTMEFGDYCGVICEISGIVKGHNGEDANFFKDLLLIIQSFEGDCPEIAYQMSLYTDV